VSNNKLDIQFMELAAAGAALAGISPFGRKNADLRIAGAFAVDRARYQALAAEMIRHIQELRGAVCAHFGMDWLRSAQYLRYPTAAWPLLKCENALDPFLIGRIDFVVSEGIPRIVEFNMTSSVGSAAAIEKMHTQLASCSGLNPPGWPNRARLDIVCSELLAGRSKTVYLPTWPWSHIADPAAFFRDSCEYLSERGADIRLIELSALGSALDRDPDAIVLRLFDTADAQSAGIDLHRIGLGVPGRGRWIMNELPNLVSSKSLMACRTLQRTVGEGSGYLAPTWIVGKSPTGDAEFQSIDIGELERDQLRYVLKPAYGHSGRQVVIGTQVSAERWRSALSLADESPFVAQQWFPPDPMPIAFCDLGTGETLRFRTPAVFGMYVVSDRAEGVLVRVLPAAEPTGAINSGRGAVVSALMLQ
jgi:hypothetical protein